jgi:glycosyltransferase 2 family protein
LRMALPIGLGLLALLALLAPALLSRLRVSALGRSEGFGRWVEAFHIIGTGRFATLVGLSVPVWLGMGAATWFVALALGLHLPVSEVLFATSAAWLIGFLVVPAPGGIGVREAVFVVTLTSVSPGTASAIAIVARGVSMAADLGGALLSAAAERRHFSRRP